MAETKFRDVKFEDIEKESAKFRVGEGMRCHTDGLSIEIVHLSAEAANASMILPMGYTESQWDAFIRNDKNEVVGSGGPNKFLIVMAEIRTALEILKKRAERAAAVAENPVAKGEDSGNTGETQNH